MSTKTNFKRIALVAVAALGLGVLSSVPSQASIPVGNIVLTTTAGTVTAASSDSRTAAKVVVNFLKTATTDSVIVSATLKSAPTTVTGTPKVNIMALDTVGSTVATALTLGDTTTGTSLSYSSTAGAYLGATYGVFLESTSGASRPSGTYVITFIATPYEANSAVVANIKTIDVTITQAALATEGTTASSTTSTAYLQQGASFINGTTDSTVAVPATATGANVAVTRVTLNNSGGVTTTVKDTLTVTIDKGNVSISGAVGKNVVAAYAGSAIDVGIQGDGTPGTATLTISTVNGGTFTKTLTFYGTAYKSIIAASYRSVIGIGTSGTGAEAIKGNAYDVNSSSYGSATTLYAYSSDTTVISNYGTLCSNWSATDATLYCALTGVKAGTATITLRDAATVALSTVASNAVSVRVSAGVLTSFTLTTDKASYAPGEKGYLIVTAKDAAGLVMPYAAANTYATANTFFNKDGITFNGALGNGSDLIKESTTAASFPVKFDRSSTPSSTDPVAVFTFYAPATAGTLTFSAKGGTLMSTALQGTATTATITVADSASAALAAVSALAVTVASLKTLITTLTNLVLKIQKKVKA